ncbi:mannose-6-phosphate isomerase-like protein (cupin superfamily) [Bradyrhizobium sp. i1.8.4]|uniref:cupin domain-containing protein n=1 Tax=unclassified Bradyrhizobium TaxID=2631580 RepID=UPI003D1BD568
MTRPTSATTWTYRRADDAGIVELASWRGTGSLGLRPHFHDESQIVLVLSGSRAIRIDDATVTVPAGHAALIPAGMLHAPRPTSDEETVCLNAYVPASRASSSLRIINVGARWRSVDEISAEHILEIADDTLLREPFRSTGLIDRRELGIALTESVEPIGAIAAGFGRSREGFSRIVRRELGVAPHAGDFDDAVRRRDRRLCRRLPDPGSSRARRPAVRDRGWRGDDRDGAREPRLPARYRW